MRVFHLEYADPTEMATLLSSLFTDTSSTGSSQTPVQFNGGRGGGGGNPFARMFGGGGGPIAVMAKTSGSRNAQKVTAVADPRTSSVIVSATSGLISQIEEMIKQLDANPAKKQKVRLSSEPGRRGPEIAGCWKTCLNPRRATTGTTAGTLRCKTT